MLYTLAQNVRWLIGVALGLSGLAVWRVTQACRMRHRRIVVPMLVPAN
jgi:hypothetical protein